MSEGVHCSLADLTVLAATASLAEADSGASCREDLLEAFIVDGGSGRGVFLGGCSVGVVFYLRCSIKKWVTWIHLGPLQLRILVLAVFEGGS